MSSVRFLVLALWGMTSFAATASLQRSERTFRVAGYVLDAVSRRPVPGVLVEDEYWTGEITQTRTDSNGYFVLRLLMVRPREKIRQLIVQTVLYEGEVIVASNNEQQVVILLRRNTFRFNPYGCQQLADSARISPYAKGAIQGLPGSQFAFLIRDTRSRQPRQLRTVTFNTGPAGLPQEPFRLRVYPYEKQPVAPLGPDLLLEIIYVYPQKGTFSYDVSLYNIVVPYTGFYLAIEYVAGCDSHCIGLAPIPNYTPTGPILRPPCARADTRTWEYETGKGWHRATAAENCWPLYESALSVEVEPAASPPTKR